MVGYIPNWVHATPTQGQLSRYTHVIIGFATSTHWIPETKSTPGHSGCESDCKVVAADYLGFHGSALKNSVDFIKGSYNPPKVLLSFGGSSQGEWYPTPNGNCWEDCMYKSDYLATQLAALVADNGLDGIDIDYEYYLNTTNTETSTFLTSLTKSLRAKMESGKIITHSPRQVSVAKNGGYADGGQYYQVLDTIAGDIDHLLIQFYNANPFPLTPQGLSDTQKILRELAEGPFAAYGGYEKLVVGMLVATGNSGFASASVVYDVCNEIKAAVPTFGGLAFWDVMNCSNASASFCTNSGWNDPTSKYPPMVANLCLRTI
jgi:hypothetical protein